LSQLKRHTDKHGVPAEEFNETDDKKYFAWVIDNVKIFENPEPYKHPQ
jgi:fructose-1,6-bisphosphatase/inositol monophosphatase family enzyme